MNTEDLPSWVFFPDKERAEWINSIMKQLWPYVNEYVRTTLFTTVGCEGEGRGKYLLSQKICAVLPQVEPAVESALSGFKLSGFKFDRERVFLGQVPPRVTGIKVGGKVYYNSLLVCS